MKSFVTILVVVLALAAVPAFAAKIQINDSFATDLGGWTAINNSKLEWKATGGPDNGSYAQWTDLGEGRGTIVAPKTFLGDMFDVYNGGSISFDYKIFTPGTNIDRYNPIVITLWSGTKNYSYTVATAAQMQAMVGQGWVTLEIPMTASAWGLSKSVWGDLLGNLTGMHIAVECAVNSTTKSSQWDVVGIGGVRMVSTQEEPRTEIPEPATLTLLGLGALALFRRRRN